ncbi:hypothetical protein [Pectobacterium brasiliense]|uniref:hypothetical protein n=1 Tax=Pectobacterium brasiliense TaxID=180957 RepID=UPI000C1C06D9|nr:hypothetical protein [Pectobacterium brasiliense]ATV43812.1 hypothetical protein CTV95_10240 [Pectobacterium brasiliense]MCA6983963.1 hypothetical protein [Pectobacterium brasiliense]MCH4993507.1 hypothetical protein [Pectobacterium brasiliense]
MFNFRIFDANGKLLFNNITGSMAVEISSIDVSKNSIKKKIKGTDYRFIERKDARGQVFCISDDPIHVKSPKTLAREADLLLSSIDRVFNTYETVKNEVNVHLNRLLHNLTTINAHNLQGVYSIIPQDFINNRSGMPSRQWKSRGEQEVQKKIRETASVLIRLAKNNAHFKSEMGIYHAMLKDEFELSPHNHVLHRVLMNSLYGFFPEFTDLNVDVNVTDSTLRATFDYETIHVAFYLLLENAAKYIKPNSELNVAIKSDPTSNTTDVILRMVSLNIREDEVDKVFIEGYSGIEAINSGKSGDGIGMARLSYFLTLNNAKIKLEVYPNNDFFEFCGRKYNRNDFIITFQN